MRKGRRGGMDSLPCTFVTQRPPTDLALLSMHREERKKAEPKTLSAALALLFL